MAAAAAAMAATRPKTEVASTKRAEPEEELPWFARLVNHVLTPGSSHTSAMWVAFNVIIGILGGVWLMFVIAFPDNIHVWIFGGLFVGLCITTNWFMSEIFAAKEDFESQQKKEAANKAPEAVEDKKNQ